MPSVPKRKEERNRELIKDYKDGIVMCELNAKYKISAVRIYQILNSYKIDRISKTSRKQQ